MDYSRNIRFKLSVALKQHPAVVLVGAKGIGKTRTVSAAATESGYAYRSFMDVRSDNTK